MDTVEFVRAGVATIIGWEIGKFLVRAISFYVKEKWRDARGR
jgi:hypothetical protein